MLLVMLNHSTGLHVDEVVVRDRDFGANAVEKNNALMLFHFT